MWTTADEWSDSVEIATSGGFFRLKHDQTYLFILFDYVGDKSLESYDVAWAYIDTFRNGGNSPQPDDFGFSLQ